MWSWVLQRVTGGALFFFLLLHVLDTALVRVSPEAYDAVIGVYKHPVVGVAEVGLVAAVLLHALNGVRTVVVDVSARALRRQGALLVVVLVLWLALLVPISAVHLGNVFGGAS